MLEFVVGLGLSLGLELGIFPVEITSSMFLSQHRDAKLFSFCCIQ